MFTPHRNRWSETDRKGKAIAFADEIKTPSPSRGLLLGEDDDWRKFKEVGLLDEPSLERKDLDALTEKILKLEKELFDYQHNMGLLLMEKKKWTLTNEELQQAFNEATEILNRERTSKMIALNEADKREENLRKSLIAEKQFVAELEKDSKYWRQEHSEAKSTSEAKLAEADALVIGMKEKALVVDREKAIAEEKLSVINRKSSEVERKLKEVETREKVHQREHLSLVTEREAYEAVFYKQREELQDWEKKLTLQEDRLSEAKKSVNNREERIMESERAIKKKEKLLEETQQMIDIAKSKLTEREESINNMLNDISKKEKDFEAIKAKVDIKEKELHEFEEKLIVREQMEIGKLLDDQKAVLDSRRQEFEMELEQMRRSLDEELEGKKAEIEQLQVDISHKEEKLAKREAALEKMEERVKVKDKDLEARLRAVKENEKSIKAEEKKLNLENHQFLEEKEYLLKLKDEIEEIEARTTKQESVILEQHESLRITKEERLDFLRQQSELKQQIDRVKQEEELLLQKRKELKQDKERFEKEWEVLDEKRADIAREQKEVTEEKEKLRRLQISEKHRLKREEMTSRDDLKRELDGVKMQKESFEADMKIKKLALHENAKNKTNQLVEDLEKQKRNLDMELQRQEEEGERDFNERERTYEKRSQEELENINYTKKLAQREMEEVQYEKLALEREREQISIQKKLLKEQEVEMHNDITELDVLRSSLKEQREEFISARERFLVFLEKLKSCSSCGEITENFVLTDLRLPDVENGDKLSEKRKLKAEDAFSISPSAENSRKTSLIGKIASKLLSISPIGKADKVTDLGVTVKLPKPSQRDDRLDTVPGDDHEPSATEQSFTDSRIQEGPEVSLQSEIKSDKPRRGRGRGKSVRGRSQATKAASKDSKPSDVGTPKKRQREQASRITESEHTAGDSDEGVDSITTGGRRKKRQIAVPVSQTPGQSRYHLRRHRNVGTEEDKAQASTGVTEKQESVSGDIRTVPSPKDTLTPPQCENRENGKAEVLVEAVTHEEIVRVVAETEFNDNNTGKRPVEDSQLETGGSGEIREHGEDDDEDISMIEEENEGEEEEETERQGDASIGKKIWVFFTT
ncbi:PREDICTED: protein CROWDED NUCLEI 3 isoform X2 [Camelina sativa]|uniref:Protein CROWDED NUCLEI 3 isoform X2 n=1 Tax=Camelina sativa TaxID=90675 RepID=A0ABM0WGP3_CAMSA|nr:PREDICTED: protein CROWDED NUCLEI 3 isoform X2 [Camelina sativa]